LTGTIPSEVGNLNQAGKMANTVFYCCFWTCAHSIIHCLYIPTELMWFHKTRFTGTVPESLCEYRPDPLTVLQADCNPPKNASVPCLCCSHCCNRDTGVCLATT
jgi:hypothetical protein